MSIIKVINRKQNINTQRAADQKRIKQVIKSFHQIAINHETALNEYFNVSIGRENSDHILAISNSKIQDGFYGHTYNIAIKTYGKPAIHIGFGANSAQGDKEIEFDPNANLTKLKTLFKQSIEKLVSDCYSPHFSKK